MRIAFKRSVVLQGDISERVPSHQILRKFKRTVLYKFGIQAPVCPEVDVFEKVSVHGGLNLRTDLVRLNSQPVGVLSVQVQPGSDGQR